MTTSAHRPTTRRSHAQQVRAWALSRRGVTSVLAMMFMVMFGSLAVAMAVASQGNLRTANTHLHVVRSMGAAETGLAIAEQNLFRAVARFQVSKGVVDADFGAHLWEGSFTSGDGTVNVLTSADGRADTVQTNGVADALLNAHLADQNIVAAPGFPTQADIFTPGGDIDTAEYKADGWVRTGLVAIDANAATAGATAAAYQITYAPLANGMDVRIIATGYSSIGAQGSDYVYGRAASGDVARPVLRQIQQDYRIAKRPGHAILSPSRIMIGKNVHITGNLGAVYTDVDEENGHPITIKSDFYGIDPGLDDKLDDLFNALKTSDVDKDNRLRVGHAVEGAAIPSNTTDYDGNGSPDNAFTDRTNDGYVDEFDVFLSQYDTNGDGRVVLSSTLTAGTPAAGQSAEFTRDDDLALLIDGGNPDRNRNSISGYTDTNRNGRWDNGESITDVDPVNGALRDRILGWRDGVIDRKDQYNKVRGRLVYKTSEQSWASAHTNYQSKVQGPIKPDRGQSPQSFNAGNTELPPIDANTFADTQTPLKSAADGQSFAQQVASQLGISTANLATYTEANTDATDARYWRADLDDSYVYARTGRHLYEKMPFNSPSYSDWYYRPRYENMTFKNVQIPEGTNALFVNCTFIGVTYVRTNTANTHSQWSNYGKLVWSDSSNKPVASTDPLDKSDFLRYTSGNVVDGPANYAQFPDPPVINGVTRTGAARDTKKYSNNVRFHDCLIVGTVTSDTPQQYTHLRNKLQFTGKTRFTDIHPDEPENTALNPDVDDRDEITKTSLMTPQYSVDIGSFNSPTDTYTGVTNPQNVSLKGTIVAGLLDIRGNANIDGALMLTFAPVEGQGPLQQNGQAVGSTAGFNSTLGYFGPQDGDGEALDPKLLPVVNGVKIAGWDLDNDGIADLAPSQTPTSAQIAAGAVALPFYGYGRIELNWNPDLPMPDGVLLPLSVVPLAQTYREGRR